MTVLKGHTGLSANSIAMATVIAMSSFSAGAQADFKITAGYDYSAGDYGQEVTTEIESVPVTMNYISGPWNTKLTVPYIRVTGNGTVIPGTAGPVVFNDFFSGGFGFGFGSGGGGSSGASSTQTVTNSGLGDVSASIGYAIFAATADGTFYEFTARVKFGTADADKALGTGENDYSLQMDATYGNAEMIPFLTLGYMITGDSDQYTYDDVPFGTLGLMFKYGTASTLGISYDYKQAAVAGGDDQEQASAFINWKHSRNWSSTLAALKGFSDSSPDYGASLMLTRTY